MNHHSKELIVGRNVVKTADFGIAETPVCKGRLPGLLAESLEYIGVTALCAAEVVHVKGTVRIKCL